MLAKVPEASFATWRARVEAALDRSLPLAAHPPTRLHAAMRHAALGGGKRMRPMLVYASGNVFGADADALDAAAVAVELIHCYSLVHDDLPAMDNDAMRRGQPTVHVAFDEATAILAGDALHALAFDVLATAPQPAGQRVAMLAELARAAGAGGMCGGQALDLEATGTKAKEQVKERQGEVSRPATGVTRQPPRENHSQPFSISQLERLHALKTGALLRAAVRMGAIGADADAASRAALDRYADALGLAFQIRDDLLDVEGDSATLGKTAGKDVAQAKTTFPALLGIDASRARLAALAVTMQEALADVGAGTSALAALGRMAIERDH